MNAYLIMPTFAWFSKYFYIFYLHYEKQIVKFVKTYFPECMKKFKSTWKTKNTLASSSKQSFSVIIDSYRLRLKRRTGQTLGKNLKNPKKTWGDLHLVQ